MRRRSGVSEESVSVDEVLEGLADEHCRALLRAMDAPRNAADLSERTEVPVSTTYRKLEQLETATLIDDRIQIRSDGRHTSLYHPNFQRIVITLTDELELECQIVRAAETGDERLEHLWTEVREGV